MKVGIMVQARMGSTRLPGKVALPLGNSTVLGYMIDRLKKSKFKSGISILTTVLDEDDRVVEIARDNGVNFFRGSPTDLIERYLEAADFSNTELIVRLTGDCPMIDYRIIDQMVEFFLLNRKKIEFLTNCLTRTYARGFDVEIFTLEILSTLNLRSSELYQREHIVPLVEENPNDFMFFEYPNYRDDSKYRLTIDLEQDYLTIKELISALNCDDYSYDDIIQLIEKNRLILRNMDVKHKAYKE